jgi:hypothetical protein
MPLNSPRHPSRNETSSNRCIAPLLSAPHASFAWNHAHRGRSAHVKHEWSCRRMLFPSCQLIALDGGKHEADSPLSTIFHRRQLFSQQDSHMLTQCQFTQRTHQRMTIRKPNIFRIDETSKVMAPDIRRRSLGNQFHRIH